MIRKQLYFKQTGIDEANFTISGIFSTADEDRQGEIIDQSGWILNEFEANPVILFGHDHGQPAVGQGVNVHVGDTGDGKQGLIGSIKFAAEEYPFAATLFKLYAGRYMRAFSVGFMNEVYEIDQENDTVILRKNILYEISCVNVPANAMALAYSKGIDVAPVTDKMKELTKHVPAEEVKEIELDEALGKISASNIKTIRTAISKLTEVLKAASESDIQDGEKGRTPRSDSGGNKIPVKTLNSAIRALLKAKQIK